MYREEVYRAISADFGTGVGVATAFRVTEVVNDPQVERSQADRIRYRAAQDDWRINRIICDAIETGRYRPLVRQVFWLRQAHPDWSPRRWWTSAWSQITGRKGKGRVKKKEVAV